MATVQGVFVVLFGRPADPAGLGFLSALTKNGTDWSGLSAIAAQAEFQARFGGLSDKAAVTLLYQTAFGRTPEAAGLSYWLSKLQSGEVDRASLGVAMLDGARGSDLSTASAKIAAADLFTAHLDLPREQQSYAGSSAAQTGRSLLSAVSAEKPAAQARVDELILRLSQPSDGQKPFDGEKVVLAFTSPDLVKLTAEPATGAVILKAATINNIEFNSWMLSGEDAGAFAINRNSGAISLQKSGYLSAKEVASLTVTATDAAGNSASQVLTLALAGQSGREALMAEADAGGPPLHGVHQAMHPVETVGLSFHADSLF